MDTICQLGGVGASSMAEKMCWSQSDRGVSRHRANRSSSAALACQVNIPSITGDTLGEDGDALTEQLDLWRRNPVECIQELIGNPAFREVMQYSPERVYAYQEGDVRIFDEMWTDVHRPTCLIELPLHLLYLHPTRPSFHSSKATRQLGLSIYPLVTSQSRNFNASHPRRDPWLAIVCSTTA